MQELDLLFEREMHQDSCAEGDVIDLSLPPAELHYVSDPSLKALAKPSESTLRYVYHRMRNIDADDSEAVVQQHLREAPGTAR